MNTPEQLKAWREEFEKTETNSYLEKMVSGMYAVMAIEDRWQGYLRRCQETEKAVKDARKQALEEVLAICNGALSFPDSKYYISDKVKELLK